VIQYYNQKGGRAMNRNKGFANPNILIIMAIMPMLLMLLLNTNLSIVNSAAQFKARVNLHHSLSSSISKATQYLQYDLPLGIPVRIPEAEISINGLDVEYVAVTPLERNGGRVVYSIVAIAQGTTIERQVEVNFERSD
jgi:hypothetical protein